MNICGLTREWVVIFYVCMHTKSLLVLKSYVWLSPNHQTAILLYKSYLYISKYPIEGENMVETCHIYKILYVFTEGSLTGVILDKGKYLCLFHSRENFRYLKLNSLFNFFIFLSFSPLFTNIDNLPFYFPNFVFICISLI